VKVDLRIHKAIRDQVHAGISALRVQGKQVWGNGRFSTKEVLDRMIEGSRERLAPLANVDVLSEEVRSGVKKELGLLLFSTIRWIDDLGFDALECLDLAVEAKKETRGSSLGLQ
jgi:hypothetical protein